ncbi:MAG: glycosyltransferase family 4 protein [Elusimicrobiota bacterium]
MGSLRVLHCDFEKTFRGAENQLLTLHMGLLRQGIASAVVGTADVGLHMEMRRRRMQGFTGVSRLRPRIGEFDPVAALGLIRAVAAFNPTIVHAHSAHAAGIIYLARHFIGKQTYSVFHRTVTDALGVLSAAKYAAADLIISVSTEGKKRLLERGVAGGRIVVIPAGITICPADACDVEGPVRSAPLRDPVIGTICALDRTQKDVATLVRACVSLREKFKGLRCHIFGDGPDYKALQSLIASQGLGETVVLRGWWQGPLQDAIKQLDVFVLPTFKEGTSNVLIAAMACGLPCVASRVEGNEEVLADAGLLVPVKDTQAMADALARVITEPGLYQDLARRCHERSKLFTAEKTLQATVRCYASLMKGPTVAAGA